MGLTKRELYLEAPCSGDSVPVQDLRWFAVAVKPQHEFAVQQSLAAKGLDAHAPAYWSARRWSDRVKKLQLPLFPGYVFCRFRCSERVSVLRTVGVRSIVSFGKEPASIPDQEIAAIRKIVTSNHPVEPWPFLHAGQRVQIGEGSLAGLEGILVERQSASRFVVGIELLQRSVALEVDPAWLVPLN